MMNKQQRCIVCKANVSSQHSFYSGLCVTCGDLNYTKRNQTADLQGLFAVVTGARVNIGYAVVLKLHGRGNCRFEISDCRFKKSKHQSKI